MAGSAFIYTVQGVGALVLSCKSLSKCDLGFQPHVKLIESNVEVLLRIHGS